VRHMREEERRVRKGGKGEGGKPQRFLNTKTKGGRGDGNAREGGCVRALSGGLLLIAHLDQVLRG
jgi:hypothetical protein